MATKTLYHRFMLKINIELRKRYKIYHHFSIISRDHLQITDKYSSLPVFVLSLGNLTVINETKGGLI